MVSLGSIDVFRSLSYLLDFYTVAETSATTLAQSSYNVSYIVHNPKKRLACSMRSDCGDRAKRCGQEKQQGLEQT